MACPTCRTPMGSIRNLSLETMAKLCILCRRSAESGCNSLLAEQRCIAKFNCTGCQESPFDEEKKGLWWHQCWKGHIICDSCRKQGGDAMRCPVPMCSTSLAGDIRNHSLEQISDKYFTFIRRTPTDEVGEQRRLTCETGDTLARGPVCGQVVEASRGGSSANDPANAQGQALGPE